jgi:hypothetical protein
MSAIEEELQRTRTMLELVFDGALEERRVRLAADSARPRLRVERPARAAD